MCANWLKLYANCQLIVKTQSSWILAVVIDLKGKVVPRYEGVGVGVCMGMFVCDCVVCVCVEKGAGDTSVQVSGQRVY